MVQKSEYSHITEKDFQSKEILSFKEAALFIGISPSALYKLNHAHKIPYFKPNNKMVYYKKSDLEAFMLSNYHPSIEEVGNNIFNAINKIKK